MTSGDPIPHDPFSHDIFVRRSDGMLQSFSELLEDQKQEASLSVAQLLPGDIVAMRYLGAADGDETAKGATFEIEVTEWNDIGMWASHSPSPTVRGKLQGSDITAAESVVFVGSGFGGTMMRPGVLSTNNRPIFYSEPTRELRLPPISTFEIFRENNDGELKPLSPNQLDAEARTDSDKHTERLVQVQNLMNMFGFSGWNFQDASRGSGIDVEERSENDKYIANYSAGMALGNTLDVYDKTTGTWLSCKYFGYGNEGILQLAYAELDGKTLPEVFGYDGHWSGKIDSIPAVHRADVPIVTFITSQRYGLEAINYKISSEEAANALRIPLPDSKPNIQFWGNGVVRVPLDFPYSENEKVEPGVSRRIQEMSAIEHVDGATHVILGSKSVTLKNPDTELKQIEEYLAGDQAHTEKRGTRISRLLAAFRNR